MTLYAYISKHTIVIYIYIYTYIYDVCIYVCMHACMYVCIYVSPLYIIPWVSSPHVSCIVYVCILCMRSPESPVPRSPAFIYNPRSFQSPDLQDSIFMHIYHLTCGSLLKSCETVPTVAAVRNFCRVCGVPKVQPTEDTQTMTHAR